MKEDLKIMFYTQGEAGTWKKFPHEVTWGQFKSTETKLIPHEYYSKALDFKTNNLCFVINDIPCFKIMFENGRVFQASFTREDFSKKIGSEEQSYLDFLIKNII